MLDNAAFANRTTEASPVTSGLENYHELTRLIERLHRRFLDVLRGELNRREIEDINAVQALLLVNIGDEEINVRELMNRGYYLGSNASYNLKKLVETGYIVQQKSPHDRRATLISVTEKGRELCRAIDLFEKKQEEALGKQNPPFDLNETHQTLRRLERFWSDLMNYGL
ncbi:MarR family winged helix-turn-helix transcriptional regulator [Oceanibacterium hippocampi]|uniref:MarR family protein n=1 Tax=Oceanibacterium hippocampi TaxID=745714 RepID=A0A1Y5U020_9PROT|nr:winged helix DNA-binding protein [Oceanibacterium hippocampi]SLN77156.1 MarR family protein [Oceanibacterium hippocampi]